MRILVWAPYINPGGGSHALFWLLSALAQHKTISLVRLAIPKGFKIEDLPANVEIHELRDKFYRRLQRKLGIQLHEDLTPHLAESAVNVDLVYCNWPHKLRCPAAKQKVICTFQDTIILDYPELIGGEQATNEWQRSKEWIDNSSHVIVSSDVTKQRLTKLFPVNSQKISTIHHAVVPQNIINTSKKEALPSLPSDYFVYPANISPHKNHYNLLLAWSRYRDRKRAPLVLLGQGTDLIRNTQVDWPSSLWATRLSSLLEREGLLLGQDVILLGYVSDEQVIETIRYSRALIMPSLAEGGGSYPVEEALQLGVPVLCSDIPVMREHLATRSAEICWFDPQLPESILNALYSFDAKYSEFLSSAKAGASDPRPTWEDIAEAHVDVFQQVLGSPTRQ